MAATVNPSDLVGESVLSPEVKLDPGKAIEDHHALTPPASDDSRHGEGSRKGHYSDNDAASSSSLSDIEMDDELAGIGEGLEMLPEPASDAERMPTPETEPEGDRIYIDVKPDRVEGGVPVFCPTMEQFKDFQRYMKAINPYGMKSGIALVDPPEEWKRASKDLSEKIKTIKVKNPISQAFNGAGGFWTQENMEKQRSYNLPQWKALCEQSEHQPPAQRGTARAGTKARPPPSARPRLDDLQKRRAVRPRVNEIKEEAVAEAEETSDSGLSVTSPPTPVSPEDKSALDKEVSDEEADGEATPTKPKARRRRKGTARPKGKPGRKPGPKPGRKPGQTSGNTGGGASKKTSVASRRMHNQHVTDEEIDEEAFNDFDYHLAEVNEFDDERCGQLEQQYWKSLTFAPPMYGADMPGSLFDDDTKVWNVAHLPNILDYLDKPVPGVNTAYLYLGMWKATFAWHLEDVDLYSINYIHFGAPKQWYSISQADAPRFEKAMKGLWPNDSKYCSQFLRHKTYLISPNKLQNDYGIKVNKVVHREGQFMITYPYGYHSGFNYGYNCAESVNFALEEWLTYAQTSQKCNCAEDSVFIDVHDILRKMYPDRYIDEEVEVTDYEDDDDAAGDLPTPPASVKGKPGRKRKRQDDKNEKAAKKTKKIKINRGYQPCILCPNNHNFDDLILTSDGKLAHRKCASYTTETYIVQENGRDVVYGIGNIHKDKWTLQCNYCRQKRGVCFQCHTPKCTRAYHATCAVMAGVQVDEADTPRFYEGVEYKDSIIDLRCKTHRTVKLSRPSTESASATQVARTFSPSYMDYASNLKVNDVIQYQVSQVDSITAAVVVRPYDEDGLLSVRVLGQTPSAETKMDIDVSWLMFVDATNSTIPRCSTNAKDMPKWLADKLLSEPDKVEAAERLPAVGDPFMDQTEPSDGQAFFLRWDGFQNHSDPQNPDQKNVDINKENTLWHYLGKDSTNAKDRYCRDPKTPVYDPKCEFVSDVPQAPKHTMAPPVKRQSLPATHPVRVPVQSAQDNGVSQAAANAAARHEQLQQQRRRMLLGKQANQGRPESPISGLSPNNIPMRTDQEALLRQQQFLRRASFQNGQSSPGLPPYQFPGAVPQSPSPSLSQSPSGSTAPSPVPHSYLNYPGRQPSGSLVTSNPPYYPYQLMNGQPVRPNGQIGHAQGAATPQGVQALYAQYRQGVAKSGQAAGPQARHEYTEAWKERFNLQPNRPSSQQQRNQGLAPNGSTVALHSVNGQATASSSATSQPSYPNGQPGLGALQAATNPSSATQQAAANRPAQSVSNGRSKSNLSGSLMTPGNGFHSFHFGIAPNDHSKAGYTSPYAQVGQASSTTQPTPTSAAKDENPPRLGQDVPGARALEERLDKTSQSQSLSKTLSPSAGHQTRAPSSLPQTDGAYEAVVHPSPRPQTLSRSPSTGTPQPRVPLTLEQIEGKVRTPGGLRLIANTISTASGNLADDLTVVDGVRKRIAGSRQMGIKEWIDSIKPDEEVMLRSRCKGMGIPV